MLLLACGSAFVGKINIKMAGLFEFVQQLQSWIYAIVLGCVVYVVATYEDMDSWS